MKKKVKETKNILKGRINIPKLKKLIATRKLKIASGEERNAFLRLT